MHKSLIFAAAGAAVSMPAQAEAQPAQGWWYAGQSGQAPQRQLIFVDRPSVRRSGDSASARAMHVFEQPRGDVRAFAITYAFLCGARRFQSRDAVFSTTSNTENPHNGIVDDWSAAAPGSVAALILDAACAGRFDSEAHSIAGTPFAAADAMFRGTPQQVATGPQTGGGLLSRDQVTACLSGSAPQDSPACRQARASAERGRQPAPARSPSAAPAAAPVGSQSYDQLLDSIVQADSRDWQFNRYISGSMRVVRVERDASGNISLLRGNYRVGASSRLSGTILDPRPYQGITTPAPDAWVEARFANGRLQCLQYHDRSSCITSTRDYYRESREAEREHLEYCAITRNC